MNVLFSYAYDKRALHKNYIGVIAEIWSKNNMKNLEDLEVYFEENKI